MENRPKERQKSENRKHRSGGKECATAECNSFEHNSDGSGSGLNFFKLKFPRFPAKARR